MKKEIDNIFYKKMFAIAIPIAIQNFIYSSLNMIDTFMIGNLGGHKIAAVGAANKVFFLLNLILFGVCSGAAIFSAQFWGKKDKKSIKKVLGICLIIAISASVFFTIAALFFGEYVMRIFSNEQEVIVPGAQYLKILSISYCFTGISFSYINILRSTGEVKLPMKISVGAVLLNTLLNYVLIFGNFGAPALGVRGAAIATTVARVLECSVLLYIVYKHEYVVAAKLNEMFSFTKEFVKEFFKKTLPVICNEFMWALGITVYSIVYGHMGSDSLAATTIAQTVEQIASVLFFGLGSACAVMLGNELGSNENEKAYDYGKKFLILTVNISFIISIIVIATSPLIANIFNVSDMVKRNIINCNIAFALFLPFKVFNLVNIVGVLRSGGDTKFSLMLDMGGVWCIGVPLVAISGLLLGLPVYIVYALAYVEEIVKFIIGLIRFKSKLWVNNIVNDM